MSGSLVCVGTGMTLGAHISPIAKSHIEQADIVFSLMANGFAQKWLEDMNGDVRSLHGFYQEGKNRDVTYNEMVELVLSQVRDGKKVVAAFYGHPGVFACISHRAISKAKAEDLPARMEPGISAEDCLYADLGIDPGKTGCMHYETSQFMFFQRNIETSSHLILWQVALAGDQSFSKFSTGSPYRQVLIDLLLEHYPSDHKVILYQAKGVAIDTMRAEYIPLTALIDAELFMHTTLVIPPCKKMQPNDKVLARLAEIDKQEIRAKNGPVLSLVL